jgi:hypothetical protein
MISSNTACVSFYLGLLGPPIAKIAQPSSLNVKQIAGSTKLNQLFVQYFEESLAMDPVSATYMGRSQYKDQFMPVISAANQAKKLAFEKVSE